MTSRLPENLNQGLILPDKRILSLYELNRDDPLTRGLIFAVRPWDGGSGILDIVNGVMLRAANVPLRDPEGNGIRVNTDEGFQHNSGFHVPDLPITIAARLRRNCNAGFDCQLSGAINIVPSNFNTRIGYERVYSTTTLTRTANNAMLGPGFADIWVTDANSGAVADVLIYSDRTLISSYRYETAGVGSPVTAATGATVCDGNTKFDAPDLDDDMSFEYIYIWARDENLTTDELAKISDNPDRIYRSLRPSRIYLSSDTAGVVVDIPNGSIALLGQTPSASITENQSVEIPIGSISLIGLTPNIAATNNQTIDIPTGSATLTGYVPDVTGLQGLTVEVPLGAPVLAGNVPTASATEHQTINVPLAALSLVGLIPQVAATEHQSIDIPVGSITLTGNAPVVTAYQGVTIPVPVGSPALIGQIPGVSATQNVSIDIPIGSPALTGYAPQINGAQHVSIDIATGNINLAGYAPVVTGLQGTVVQVPDGTLLLNGSAPDVSYTEHISVEIPNTGLSLIGFAPTVTGSIVYLASPNRTIVIGGDDREIVIH